MDSWFIITLIIHLLFFILDGSQGHTFIKFIRSGDRSPIQTGLAVYPEQSEGKSIARRQRRSSDADKSCPKLPGKPTRHWSSLAGDRNFNLALVWVGRDSPTQLLLTTLEFGLILKIRAPSKLYRRKDREISFHLIQNEIGNGDIRRNFGIMKSPLNGDKVILISFSYVFSQRMSILYRSTDGANSFEEIRIPFQVRQNEPFQFHPTQEDWILALDNGRPSGFGAWLSTDFGKTWKRLMSLVDSVKWGMKNGVHDEEKTIFLTTKVAVSGLREPMFGTLWRSRDLGVKFVKLVEHVHNFGIQGKFLFVSVNYKKDDKRIVHVSSDGGDRFNPVNIPAIEPERFFSILDMSEGMIFLHVDEEGDTGHGTLYISDADGLSYTKSLERHFYTNDGVTDFYKVESMRGVYITHQLEQTENTIKSLITFNRGVTWQPLHLTSKQCQGAEVRNGQTCSLNYHSTYSQLKGVPIQPPISTETALGLILLHGHHGDALTGRTDVYLSNNGGYDWSKILSGPHHYAIGDHGSLIVAVSKQSDSTNSLLYSLDRGHCWNTLEFSDNNLTVRGLITEPGSKTRTFSLWGYENGATVGSKEWVVVTVDFHNVFTHVCHDEDYATWYPHANGGKEGCLLGVKEVYPQVKEGVFCFNGKHYKPKITRTPCKCTDEDLECDFGFELKDKKCVRNTKIPLQICKDGKEHKISDSLGYRRLPGDQCTGGPTESAKYIETGKSCGDEKENNYGIVSEEPKKYSKQNKHKSSHVVLYVSLPVLALAIIVTLGFVRKTYWQHKRKETFRYSQLKSLSDEDEPHGDANGYDPRPKGLRPYRDESDAESDTQMLDI